MFIQFLKFDIRIYNKLSIENSIPPGNVLYFVMYIRIFNLQKTICICMLYISITRIFIYIYRKYFQIYIGKYTKNNFPIKYDNLEIGTQIFNTYIHM